MRRLLPVLGIVLALATGLWWLRDAPAIHGHWILHFNGNVNRGFLPYFDDLVAASPEGVRVVAAVSNERDEELVRRRYVRASQVQTLRVARPLSPWARDRYVLFDRRGRRTCLTLPTGWTRPHLAGDLEVPDGLSRLDPSLDVMRSPFAPVGGDTIVTDRAALVGAGAIEEIRRRTRASHEVVLHELAALFARPVVVIPRVPHADQSPHIDLFVADAGDAHLLVTDPEIKLDSAIRAAARTRLGQFDAAHNRHVALRLDIVARKLEEAGFRVSRVPGLFSKNAMPGQNQPTILTYTNVILHQDTAYLPRYGIGGLDAAARASWTRAGYRVIGIRAEVAALNGGAVRCFTNVWAR